MKPVLLYLSSNLILMSFPVSRKYYLWLALPLLLLVAFICKSHQSQSEAKGTGNYLSNPANNAPFRDMLGVNAFEWNLLQNPVDPNNTMVVYEPKMKVLEGFAGMRHYLDWGRIEGSKGKYTFAPAHNGGWNYDAMYQRCKEANIDMLADLKTCPDWLLETYPKDMRDAENVPAPYGSDRKQPVSYILQAKAAFQFAARYGSNKKVSPSLISVADPLNQPKAGLNLVKYIECDNERDKWWKGDKAKQSAEEYAANMSAFYDGDKGKLGKNVGVKKADPNMKVVMGGLASADVAYVEKMIEWCKVHRGHRANGSVDLCFDVINYHLYANDHKQQSSNNATVGVAPELTDASALARAFVVLGNKYHLPVWVTEAGYDVNQQSPQRAIPVGNKSALITQADWLLRTALLYEREGIKKLFFYELYDDNLQNAMQYASCGLVTNDLKRRPAADYILQAKNLLGNYSYQKTISNNPIVDLYKYGQKSIYVLTVPDQKGRTATYTLHLPGTRHVIMHIPQVGADKMTDQLRPVIKGQLTIEATETPVFVEIKD